MSISPSRSPASHAPRALNLMERSVLATLAARRGEAVSLLEMATTLGLQGQGSQLRKACSQLTAAGLIERRGMGVYCLPGQVAQEAVEGVPDLAPLLGEIAGAFEEYVAGALVNTSDPLAAHLAVIEQARKDGSHTLPHDWNVAG